METMSTHPPEAVQTSLPTTIQPADTSTPPLPATEDEATRKERRENFRRALDLFRTYEKLGSGESSSSDLKKDSFRSSDSRCVSRKEKARSYDIDIDFKKNPDHKCALRPVSLPTPPNFSESLFSHLLKKVATADGDSVLSLDSGLGSLESLSSDLKKDSFQSSDSRISLERKVSSKYSCVSRKEKTLSYQHSIDFKKNPDDKCSFRSASAPARLDSSESLFSHLLKDVATDDDDSVQSSHSGISLERKVSSGSIDMSRKRRKTETESYAHSSTFKKKISLERKDSSGFSCESGRKEKEKTTPPTTQELVVGSSAGIET